MREVQFDSFGEPLPNGRAGNLQAQGRASRWVTRAGMALFWSLVVLIVSARAFYFDPDFAGKFGHLAALARSALTMIGA